jgi:CubicO group peptidase (beta-lactamase class C family)
MRLTLDLAAAALQAASWMFPSTGTPTLEPEPEPELRDTILQPSTRAYLSSLRERWGVPGVAISVVVGPKYDGGDWRSEHVLLGEADVHGSPITSDSMFGIASNSKLFAALAMGMVIDNGTKVPHTGEKLDWRTKVVDVLPDWKVPDEYATRHITIRDLLSACTAGRGADDSDALRPAEPRPEPQVSWSSLIRSSQQARRICSRHGAQHAQPAYER